MSRKRNKNVVPVDGEDRLAEVAAEIIGQLDPPQGMLASVTKPNQIRQEQSLASDVDGEGQGDRLPSAQREQGRQMALDLAETIGDIPDWEASFKLARRLRSLSEDRPEQFEDAVQAFCEKTGRPWEAFWYEYLVVWEKVRSKEGDDALGWAAAQAKAEPYTHTSCLLGDRYSAIASIAWHLSRLTAGKPFWLPRSRLAEMFGVSQMTVSRIVTLLEHKNIIRCAKNEYSYIKREAKEYIFVGPTPVEAPAAEVDAAPAVKAAETPSRPKCRFSDKQSEKAPYKSRFGDVWLTPAQHLAERMCTRLASHEGGELPERYWQNPKWKTHFDRQLMCVNRLLRQYDREAVSRALKTPAGKKAYSLGSSWAEEMVQAEQERLNIQKLAAQAKAREFRAPNPEPDSSPPAPETPRTAFVSGESLLSKLRDL